MGNIREIICGGGYKDFLDGKEHFTLAELVESYLEGKEAGSLEAIKRLREEMFQLKGDDKNDDTK